MSGQDSEVSNQGLQRNLHDGEASTREDLRAPLIPTSTSPSALRTASSSADGDSVRNRGNQRDFLRQRSARTNDLEDGTVQTVSIDGSRILDRSGAFRQSRGRWSVHRQSRRPVSDGTRHSCYSWICRSCCCRQEHVWHDWNLGGWFHRLAYQRTGILMLILFLTYAAIVLSFAIIYFTAAWLGQTTETNPDGSETVIAFCHMDVNDELEALYLSLSTMAAIGYGVSNYFLGDCWTPFFLVMSQVGCAILFDAVAVGLLFHRISRGRKRSRTIAFSDKAVVQTIQGIPYLMFRMGELRRYHLIGSKIHCYCVKHERVPIPRVSSPLSTSPETTDGRTPIETTYFVSRKMKLVHPDESKSGSEVWMGLPQVIVHRLDTHSPLVPPPTWYDANGMKQQPNSKAKAPSGLDKDPLATPSSGTRGNEVLDQVEDYLIDRDAEIVVLVEGNDEGTGAATQARHSYKVGDIAWNHRFLPCIFPYRRDGSDADLEPTRPGQPVCSIDFTRFHDVAPVYGDCEASPFVPEANVVV